MRIEQRLAKIREQHERIYIPKYQTKYAYSTLLVLGCFLFALIGIFDLVSWPGWVFWLLCIALFIGYLVSLERLAEFAWQDVSVLMVNGIKEARSLDELYETSLSSRTIDHIKELVEDEIERGIIEAKSLDEVFETSLSSTAIHRIRELIESENSIQYE